MKDALKGLAALFGFLTLLIVVVAFLNLGGLAIYGFTKPAVNRIERDSNIQSQQYVETKQQLMLNLVQDIRRIDADISTAQRAGQDISPKLAQKKATLDRLQQEVTTIPAESVPEPVRQILTENGRFQ